MQTQQRHQATQPKEKLNDWTDLFFGEGKDVGFLAILDRSNPDNPKHRYYKRADLPQLVRDTKGKPQRYISLNSFNRMSRKSDYACQVRTIGIDIDQYKKGLTFQDVMQRIHFLATEGKMPLPNLVLKSRGVQIFYSIQDGASIKMAWLQHYITTEIIKLLEDMGADPQANDASRVLRVPESINTRNNSIVQPQIWEPYAYTLDELRAYFPDVKRYRKPKEKKGVILPYRNLNANRGVANVNQMRAKDIEKLIQLRKGDLTGCRNTALYLYCYHTSQNLTSLEALLSIARHVFEPVYSRTDAPLTETEFERTAESAYKDGRCFIEALKQYGCRLFRQGANRDGIVKPFKTNVILDRLNITEAEQQQLRTLVNTERAYKLRMERQTARRRQQGILPRAEYLQNHTEAKLNKQAELIRLLNSDPSITKKELADRLSVSQATLYRYLKELKDKG